MCKQQSGHRFCCSGGILGTNWILFHAVLIQNDTQATAGNKYGHSWHNYINTLKSFSKNFETFNYVYVHLCESMYTWVKVTKEARGGHWVPWVEVTGDCHLPNMSARDPTWILSNRTKHWPLSHFSSQGKTILSLFWQGIMLIWRLLKAAFWFFDFLLCCIL